MGSSCIICTICDMFGYLGFYQHISAFSLNFSLSSIFSPVMKAFVLPFTWVSRAIVFILPLLCVVIDWLTFGLELIGYLFWSCCSPVMILFFVKSRSVWNHFAYYCWSTFEQAQYSCFRMLVHVSCFYYFYHCPSVSVNIQQHLGLGICYESL